MNFQSPLPCWVHVRQHASLRENNLRGRTWRFNHTGNQKLSSGCAGWGWISPDEAKFIISWSKRSPVTSLQVRSDSFSQLVLTTVTKKWQKKEWKLFLKQQNVHLLDFFFFLTNTQYPDIEYIDWICIFLIHRFQTLSICSYIITSRGMMFNLDSFLILIPISSRIVMQLCDEHTIANL